MTYETVNIPKDLPGPEAERMMCTMRRHVAHLHEHEAKQMRAAREAGAIVLGDGDPPALPESLEEWPDTRVQNEGPLPDLEAYQAFVGGLIQVVCGDLVDGGGEYTAIIHDSGRIDRLPFNPVASAMTGRLLCGPVWLLCGEAAELDREEG